MFLVLSTKIIYTFFWDFLHLNIHLKYILLKVKQDIIFQSSKPFKFSWEFLTFIIVKLKQICIEIK